MKNRTKVGKKEPARNQSSFLQTKVKLKKREVKGGSCFMCKWFYF